MNNDAFQKLVRERSNVKSSKEIAREAVQEEFRKKRGRQQQRRGGGGGSDDDDDDVGSSDEEGGSRQKRQPDKRSKNRNDDDYDKQQDEKHDVDASSAYRDRAKERREAAGMTQKTEVVLVKGLDLNLARSVKKQDSSNKGTNRGKGGEETSFVQNRQEALQFISSAGSSTSTTAPVKSELGKEMLEYLRTTFLKDNTSDKSIDSADKKIISATPAGMAIQQSVLTFSIHANPGDTVRAWEVPREQTYASVDCRRLYEKASPCSNVLILESMEKALERNKYNNNNTRGRQQTTAVAKKSKQKQDDDSDDDDIFGNVGEYDPISETNPDHKNDDRHEDDKVRPKVEKGSLFEQDNGSKDEQVATSVSVLETGVLEEQCREGDAALTSSTSTRLVGLSSSSFNATAGTSYGDEMDVDFDGRIQDEEEEEGNKKKKKKRKRKKGTSGSDDED